MNWAASAKCRRWHGSRQDEFSTRTGDSVRRAFLPERGERQTAPVPARQAGTFRQWPAKAPGLAAFASVWAHRLPDDGACSILVASNATIDLQWIGHAFRV